MALVRTFYQLLRYGVRTVFYQFVDRWGRVLPAPQISVRTGVLPAFHQWISNPGARIGLRGGGCTRLLQHCIDHGTSVAQCRVACEEWHHACTAARSAFAPIRIADLDDDMLTARDHVAVKTAMKKEQVRESERYRRKTRLSPPFT